MHINTNTMKGNTKVIFASVVAFIAALGGGFYYWQQSHANTVAVVVDPKKYKDGTYTADGTYGTPAGQETLGVTITLSGGNITSAQVTNNAKSDVSKNFVDRFSKGYSTYVVGKYLDSVSLKSVSGASLTPKGFMDALANIKAQAKS
jgi:uncharacterized protein with FMN-binding domain